MTFLQSQTNLILLGLILLGFPSIVIAQKGIEGLWTGKITLGGIRSTEGYRMELYIARNGKRVDGRSYIYTSDSTRFEMQLTGTYFKDRSIYFEDIKYMPIEGQDDAIPDFFRVFELLYRRSIWESTLNGWWQEGNEEQFGLKRKRGRVFLKKVKETTKA